MSREDDTESRQAGKDIDAVLAGLIKGRGHAGGGERWGRLNERRVEWKRVVSAICLIKASIPDLKRERHASGTSEMAGMVHRGDEESLLEVGKSQAPESWVTN